MPPFFPAAYTSLRQVEFSVVTVLVGALRKNA